MKKRWTIAVLALSLCLLAGCRETLRQREEPADPICADSSAYLMAETPDGFYIPAEIFFITQIRRICSNGRLSAAVPRAVIPVRNVRPIWERRAVCAAGHRIYSAMTIPATIRTAPPVQSWPVWRWTARTVR